MQQQQSRALPRGRAAETDGRMAAGSRKASGGRTDGDEDGRGAK